MTPAKTSRPSTAAPILAVLAIVLVTLPILYVLSIGPATWLFLRGYLDDATLETIYTPLWRANDAMGTHEWLGWYLFFWQ